MALKIRHETVYRYAEPARQSVQNLKLTPRAEMRQRTLRWEMSAPGRRSEQIDAHGNIVHLLSIDEPHEEISIVVSGVSYFFTNRKLAKVITTCLRQPSRKLIR